MSRFIGASTRERALLLRVGASAADGLELGRGWDCGTRFFTDIRKENRLAVHFKNNPTPNAEEPLQGDEKSSDCDCLSDSPSPGSSSS